MLAHPLLAAAHGRQVIVIADAEEQFPARDALTDFLGECFAVGEC